MALVPDTYDFSLWDIYNVVGYLDLYNCFYYYNSDWIDSYYWYNEEGMRCFRNYGPKDYINLSPSVLYYYQGGGSYSEYYFTIDSNVDWTISPDTSEITSISFSPSSGYAGSTTVYCFVESYNYNDWVCVSHSYIENSTHTVSTYFTVCQDGNYGRCA